jgi:CTP synthase
MPNAPTIYQVPLTLHETGIDQVVLDRLGIKPPTEEADLTQWRAIVERALDKDAPKITVGVVAKYLDNTDTYMSVFESIRHAAWKHGVQADIRWISAEKLNTNNVQEQLADVDGVLIPGGFGSRGIDGKIAAAQYALTSKKPYLGLCLGMQVAVIAAARNAGLSDANSREFDPASQHIVIDTMDGQHGKEHTGGTMRLGNYPCVLAEGSHSSKAYGASDITERHRHRYEASNDYRDQYESWGIRAVGTSPDNNLVEVIEAIDHPFMVASQFHPEFKSRPGSAHPLFDAFTQAIVKAR